MRFILLLRLRGILRGITGRFLRETPERQNSHHDQNGKKSKEQQPDRLYFSIHATRAISFAFLAAGNPRWPDPWSMAGPSEMAGHFPKMGLHSDSNHQAAPIDSTYRHLEVFIWTNHAGRSRLLSRNPRYRILLRKLLKIRKSEIT